MAKKFTKADVGCWIDGAYGEEHAKAKLAAMLRTYADPTSLIEETIDDMYRDDTGDDAFRDATSMLEDVTPEGLVWIWEAGDLILTTESEVEA